VSKSLFQNEGIHPLILSYIRGHFGNSEMAFKFINAAMRVLSVCILMAIAGPAATQQAYPNKPIRLILPYPTGGSNDVLARLLAPKLSENWGQAVVVENRAGGNSVIGTEAVAKSAPDGYTVLLTSNIHVTAPLLVVTPYDPVKDFAPIASIAVSEFVLVVHPSLPVKNLQEFIAYAKSKPGQLDYATPGAGSANHLAVELFNMMTGVKMQHIPYKGGGPALVDVLGGQAKVYMNVPISLIPHIRSGKLRALAISGQTRLPALAEVPTLTEGGLTGTDVNVWYGVLAPAGTPKDIVAKISTEIGRILATPAFREKLDSQGMSVFTSTPEQFAALIVRDLARYANIIKSANIKLEQ